MHLKPESSRLLSQDTMTPLNKVLTKYHGLEKSHTLLFFYSAERVSKNKYIAICMENTSNFR